MPGSADGGAAMISACEIYGIHPMVQIGDYKHCNMCGGWFLPHPDGDGSSLRVEVEKVERSCNWEPNSGMGIPHYQLTIKKQEIG